MNKHGSDVETEGPVSRHMKRARLQALLFAGAAFGTALVTLASVVDPKLPPFRGE